MSRINVIQHPVRSLRTGSSLRDPFENSARKTVKSLFHREKREGVYRNGKIWDYGDREMGLRTYGDRTPPFSLGWFAIFLCLQLSSFRASFLAAIIQLIFIFVPKPGKWAVARFQNRGISEIDRRSGWKLVKSGKWEKTMTNLLSASNFKRI